MPSPRRLAAALCAALAACSGADDPPPPDPCATAVPGPGWLAYASRRAGNYDVRLVAADGSCDRALTTDPGDELAPSFSVAANAVAYAGVRGGKQVILVHDLATGDERVLDTGDLSAANPAISPDGATVAFEGRAAGDDADVYLVPLAGGAPPVALAPSDAADGGPAWGDGETLYFVSDRTVAGSFEVWRARTDGSDPEPLTSWATRAVGTGAVLGKPAVSPDGLALAFARTASSPGFSRVVIRTIALGLAAGAERILAAQDDSEPCFDPRGGAVAVTTWESGDAELVVRALADGAPTARLTASPGVDGAPAYSR